MYYTHRLFGILHSHLDENLANLFISRSIDLCSFASCAVPHCMDQFCIECYVVNLTSLT
jgi:hypothetical protein